MWMLQVHVLFVFVVTSQLHLTLCGTSSQQHTSNSWGGFMPDFFKRFPESPLQNLAEERTFILNSNGNEDQIFAESVERMSSGKHL